MLAIFKAAKYVLNNKHNYSTVIIHCDSQAALKAIQNPYVRSNMVADTVRLLQKLKTEGIKVTIRWIKAHVGITGNEAADLAARVGALEVSRTTPVRKSDAHFKAQFKTWLYDKWSDRWNLYKEARQTKQFFSGPELSKAKALLKLSRWEISNFLGLVTGHNNLNYHSSLIDPNIEDSCRFCCKERETFFHWATECPNLYTYRTDCFLDQVVCNDMKWSVRDVLKFANKPELNEALF